MSATDTGTLLAKMTQEIDRETRDAEAQRRSVYVTTYIVSLMLVRQLGDIEGETEEEVMRKIPCRSLGEER